MATEEQLLYNAYVAIGHPNNERAGQKLTVPNREVTKLGFWLFKQGAPTGMITFIIYRVSDEAVLASKDWGDASALDVYPNVLYCEVEFGAPVVIDTEVVMCAVDVESSNTNFPNVAYQNTDVKADENLRSWNPSSWTERLTWDCAYRYTYETAPAGWQGKINGVTNPASIMGVDVANIVSVNGVA